MKTLKPALFGFAALLVLPTSCSRSEPSASTSPGATTYEVRGVVRAVEREDSTLIIEHEEIPGYMPSMTMPFTVKAGEDVEGVETGEAVSFEFVVTGDDSWIQRVRPVDPATVHLPEKAGVPVAAAPKIKRLEEGDRLPDFELTDQKGRAIDAGTFDGKSLVLTFIFTRCPVPNFCPLMSSHFKTLEERIKQSPALAGRTHLLSISFDPEHDTPEVLADYAAVHTDDGDFWRFACGQPAEVEKLTRAFSVYTETANGTINHGLCTALVEADGTIRRIWRGNFWKPDEVIEALGETPVASSKP